MEEGGISEKKEKEKVGGKEEWGKRDVFGMEVGFGWMRGEVLGEDGVVSEWGDGRG